MTIFFLSFALIIGGGILSLFLYRSFTLMKTVTILLMTCGCLSGLVDALFKVFHSETTVFSVCYLHLFTLAFKIDALSAFFIIPILGVSLFAVLYSFDYLHDSNKGFQSASSYLFLSILIIAMVSVVMAHNMITFMLAWETMSLSSFFLVIYDYQEETTRKAGFLYFAFTHIGALFILAAFGVSYAFTGSFQLEATANLPFTIKAIIFGLALIGFGSKAGIFPFHIWLPYAHPAAPSHISALLSGVMIKTGIYGIIRMYSFLGIDTPVFGTVILLLGVISGILGVVYALGQHDLKKLLAYCSVENIGIILIGMGIGMIGASHSNTQMAVIGFTGGLLHVLNHAIFKSLLFMGAGVVLHQTGTRSIEQLGGLMKKLPVTGTCFLIGSLAISGIPPFNGFISEFLIYYSGFSGIRLDEIPFILSTMAVLSLAVIGGLALACFTKVVGIVFLGEPRKKHDIRLIETGACFKVSMICLASFCAIIGVFPEIFIRITFHAVEAIGIPVQQVHLATCSAMARNITWIVILFAGLLGGVFLFRFIVYQGKDIRVSSTWGCGFAKESPRIQYTGSSFAASILKIFTPVAPLKSNDAVTNDLFPEKWQYHSKQIDIGETVIMSSIVQPILLLFNKQRWIQHGDIHLYIGYILLTIIILLFFV
ncbi:MAG: hydrogenase [Candidatus Magnetomorum sp.]|nr:hydrogenase [Candidatus Magnetomorum sp.]